MHGSRLDKAAATKKDTILREYLSTYEGPQPRAVPCVFSKTKQQGLDAYRSAACDGICGRELYYGAVCDVDALKREVRIPCTDSLATFGYRPKVEVSL